MPWILSSSTHLQWIRKLSNNIKLQRVIHIWPNVLSSSFDSDYEIKSHAQTIYFHEYKMVFAMRYNHFTVIFKNKTGNFKFTPNTVYMLQRLSNFIVPSAPPLETKHAIFILKLLSHAFGLLCISSVFKMFFFEFSE